MSEHAPTRLWTMRLVFAILVMGLLFLRLLPLQTATGGLIWPDFLLAFALAWSVRRPDYVPAALLAGAFLLADLLLQRPPGLWAALALVGCERIKAQARSLRDASLLSELMSVALWIIGIGLAYRILLGLLLIDAPAYGPVAIQILVTLLAYPLVAAITHLFMGVRKAAPADISKAGIRS